MLFFDVTICTCGSRKNWGWGGTATRGRIRGGGGGVEQYEEATRQKRMLAAAAARLARPALTACFSHWRQDWVTEEKSRLAAAAMWAHETRAGTVDRQVRTSRSDP